MFRKEYKDPKGSALTYQGWNTIHLEQIGNSNENLGIQGYHQSSPWSSSSRWGSTIGGAEGCSCRGPKEGKKVKSGLMAGNSFCGSVCSMHLFALECCKMVSNAIRTSLFLDFTPCFPSGIVLKGMMETKFICILKVLNRDIIFCLFWSPSLNSPSPLRLPSVFHLKSKPIIPKSKRRENIRGRNDARWNITRSTIKWNA